MSILLYSLKGALYQLAHLGFISQRRVQGKHTCAGLAKLFSARFHVALCARTNRERGAVLCECFGDGLPDLSVVALRLSPGQLFLQEWPACSYPPSSATRRLSP